MDEQQRTTGGLDAQPTAPLSPEQQKKALQEKLKKETTGNIHAFENQQQQTFVGETLEAWCKRLAPGIRTVVPTIDQTIRRLQGLPPRVLNHWNGRLTQLKNLAARDIPNPTAITEFALILQRGGERSELAQLNALILGTFAPGQHPAVQAINELLEALRRAIGPLHPGVVIADPAFRRNLEMSERGRDIIRQGGFILGAGMGILWTAINLMAKEDDQNWRLPAIYFGVAGFAALYHGLTESGTALYASEIDWLTRVGGPLERLRGSPPDGKGYPIRGPHWGRFIQRYYERGQTDSAFVSFLRDASREPTAAELKAIKALAPVEIHPTIELMLQSRDGATRASDLRAFLGLLNQARDTFARNTVILYIQSGAGPESIAQVQQFAAAQRRRAAGPSGSQRPAGGPPPVVTSAPGNTSSSTANRPVVLPQTPPENPALAAFTKQWATFERATDELNLQRQSFTASLDHARRTLLAAETEAGHLLTAATIAGLAEQEGNRITERQGRLLALQQELRTHIQNLENPIIKKKLEEEAAKRDQAARDLAAKNAAQKLIDDAAKAKVSAAPPVGAGPAPESAEWPADLNAQVTLVETRLRTMLGENAGTNLIRAPQRTVAIVPPHLSCTFGGGEFRINGRLVRMQGRRNSGWQSAWGYVNITIQSAVWNGSTFTLHLTHTGGPTNCAMPLQDFASMMCRLRNGGQMEFHPPNPARPGERDTDKTVKVTC